MSTIRYRDSDKSINNSSIDDYLTLANYHDSFYNAVKTSQLRMAIVPGTVKYFNQSFSYDKVKDYQTNVSEAAITPLPRKKNEDQYDYMSYPKLK